MGLKKNNPGCNCCSTLDGSCTQCNAITAVIITGFDTGTCPECAEIDGTYVFRTLGTSGCVFSGALVAASFCGGFPDDLVTFAFTGCTAQTRASYSIEFLSDPGGVKIRVTVVYGYSLHVFTMSGYDAYAGYYLATYEDVFPTCADAIGQTLPLAGIAASDLCTEAGNLGIPPDFCDVSGLTIELA